MVPAAINLIKMLRHLYSLSHPCPLRPLQELQGTLREQGEQQASLEREAEGYRRQLAVQLQRNEQAAEVVARLEGQEARLGEQMQRVRQRQAELQVCGGG